MGSSTARRRAQSDDPLNDLPEAILSRILSLLSTKEAVRTSLLSRSWRRSWCCLPKLDLDHQLAPNPDLDTWPLVSTETKSRWEENAHQILLAHCGSIDSCRIVPPSCHATRDFSHMDFILEILVQKGTRKLQFLNYGGFAYPLHPCLFGYRSPEILKLRGCEFNRGFEVGSPTNLRSIMLQSVKIDEEIIRKLATKCRFLEDLALDHCWGSLLLEIRSPSLIRLSLVGSDGIKKIVIEAPKLSELTMSPGVELQEFDISAENLNSFSASTYPHSQADFCGRETIEKTGRSLSMIMKNVAYVGTLKLRGFEFKCLSAGDIPKCLPPTFPNIKKLAVQLMLDERRRMNLLVRLLKSCPCLQELELVTLLDISVKKQVNDMKFWTRKGSFHCLDYSLERVQLRTHSGEFQFGFAAFIVKRAKVLKRMAVRGCISPEHAAAAEKLLSLRRASPDAQIIIQP